MLAVAEAAAVDQAVFAEVEAQLVAAAVAGFRGAARQPAAAAADRLATADPVLGRPHFRPLA